MFREVLFVSILTLYPVVLLIFSRRPSPKQLRPATTHWRRSAEQVTIILLLLLLQPNCLHRLDFDRIGRGIVLRPDILSGLISFFVVGPLMALLPFGRLKTQIDSSTEVFGYPAKDLPVSYAAFPMFVLDLIIGVIFEELLCRQFLFYGYYHVFGIRGDWLLVISSLLFAVGHSYKRRRDYLVILLTGLLLGKIFQTYGTIVLPMVLHFCSNTTLIILAYKRIARNPIR